MLVMVRIAVGGTHHWGGSWAPVLLLHGLQTSKWLNRAGKREPRRVKLAFSCIPFPRAHTRTMCHVETGCTC